MEPIIINFRAINLITFIIAIRLVVKFNLIINFINIIKIARNVVSLTDL